MDYFTKKPVRAARMPGPAACRQGRRARAAGGPHAPGGSGRTGRRKIFTALWEENTGLRLAATGLRPVFTGIGPVRTGLSPVIPETGAVRAPAVGAVRTGGGGGGRPAPGGQRAAGKPHRPPRAARPDGERRPTPHEKPRCAVPGNGAPRQRERDDRGRQYAPGRRHGRQWPSCARASA